MTHTAARNWHKMRTNETIEVEKVLRDAGFSQVDAYRYNSASIRVRVIDARFASKSAEERDSMVEPYLKKLPERTQADIVNLFTFAPEEIASPDVSFRHFFMNREFEDPSPSML
jgi:hypothetical protein